MVEQVTVPRAEDFVSVGSRISWGAIFAGAVLAFGLYSLLTVLGGAVGLSISERVRPTTLHNTAIGWAFITLVASVFVGGVVTSQFTVGENKTEAMLYGVIMWALLFGFFAVMSAAGIRTGFHTFTDTDSHTASAQAWDKAARQTGVTVDHKMDNGKVQDAHRDEPTDEATKEAVTRLTWYAFIGTWVSMIAAALGAIVGAGPRFKVVAVRTPNRMVV